MALLFLPKVSGPRVPSTSRAVAQPPQGPFIGYNDTHPSRSRLMPCSSDDLVIVQTDFPKGWENGHHPDDYKILSAPIEPEYFINSRYKHVRMWFRISFKIADGQYMPMSFLVNTNAPWWLYLGDKALETLTKHGRLEDSCIRLQNGLDVRVAITPDSHQPTNLIGIELIQKFELSVKPGSWRWMNGIGYW
ncbi:hypothetical protein DFH07DRAFT_775274 [Mycena maculata]|uniref:Uncharacterized protein n=1 Tax=Mycena maculata TaxID=230809 RepID=A0AAD7IVA4_9AGAR|nr:hypothetical protein DFH07DRAFT_775274 [Mycena maculata]